MNECPTDPGAWGPEGLGPGGQGAWGQGAEGLGPGGQGAWGQGAEGLEPGGQGVRGQGAGSLGPGARDQGPGPGVLGPGGLETVDPGAREPACPPTTSRGLNHLTRKRKNLSFAILFSRFAIWTPPTQGPLTSTLDSPEKFVFFVQSSQSYVHHRENAQFTYS